MPAAVVPATNLIRADQLDSEVVNVSLKIALGRTTWTVTEATLLQLPAASWTRRLNWTWPDWMPASGIVAETPVPESIIWTGVALPAPGSVVPFQNSAPWKRGPTYDGSTVSVTPAERVSVVAPFVGLGLPVIVPRTGAVLSTRSRTKALSPVSPPQLPAASLAWTKTVCSPAGSALTWVSGMSP